MRGRRVESLSSASPDGARETNSPAASRRVLVGGVGYRFLRDLSFGPLLIDRLRKDEWPEGVEIEDLSYGPVGILHNLDARPPYDRLVLVAGVKRGRPPGSVTRYRWEGRLPDEQEIQARIEEAGSGVISLDNLLVFLTFFRRLPPEVVVVEVEGADEDWGEGFTPEVERVIPEVTRAVHDLTGKTARRFLVAGFGSLLLSDDGFGVRVLERLAKTTLPGNVELLEAGTGGVNLVLALMKGFDELLVVDALRQGRPPGSLCTFTPPPATLSPDGSVDPHFAEPTRAMGLAAALGVLPRRVTVVGCEPETCELGTELSPAVGAAVEEAVRVICEKIGAAGSDV